MDADQTVVRARPYISLVVEGPTTGTVHCCFEHECQTPAFSLPSPGPTQALGPTTDKGVDPPSRKGCAEMEVVHERCAGLGVSKRDVKVCVRAPGKRQASYVKPVSTFGSVTAEVLRLRDHLIEANVMLVVMEAIGDYWDHGGQVGLTSRALDVQENTVRFRLTRLRDSLGIDVDNPETMMDLRFALRRYDMVGRYLGPSGSGLRPLRGPESRLVLRQPT